MRPLCRKASAQKKASEPPTARLFVRCTAIGPKSLGKSLSSALGGRTSDFEEDVALKAAADFADEFARVDEHILLDPVLEQRVLQTRPLQSRIHVARFVGEDVDVGVVEGETGAVGEDDVDVRADEHGGELAAGDGEGVGTEGSARETHRLEGLAVAAVGAAAARRFVELFDVLSVEPRRERELRRPSEVQVQRDRLVRAEGHVGGGAGEGVVIGVVSQRQSVLELLVVGDQLHHRHDEEDEA